jgi:hypothetical protein
VTGIEDVLAAEGADAEAAEAGASPARTNVRVTRGHERARTLQIRLNDSELAELTSLSSERGLPVSTVARELLLQSLTSENRADPITPEERAIVAEIRAFYERKFGPRTGPRHRPDDVAKSA